MGGQSWDGLVCKLPCQPLLAGPPDRYTESLSLNRSETTVRPSHESPRQREEDLRELQSGATQGPGLCRLHQRPP